MQSALRLYTHHGAPFLSGVVNEVDDTGRTMLHRVCGPWPRGHCNRDALAALVDAGADIQARVTNNYLALMKGFTSLHTLVYFAWNPSTRDELESLMYLIQRGVSVYAVDDKHRSVSMTAYIENEFERECEWTPIGGYRGDLWDAALATCGYNLWEFRKIYPRLPRYDSRYKRSDFERLWEGIEHLCPYWDDRRWPETGTRSDYSMGADDEGSDSGYRDGCEPSHLKDSDIHESQSGWITGLLGQETRHDGIVEDKTSEIERVAGETVSNNENKVVWESIDLDNPWTG